MLVIYQLKSSSSRRTCFVRPMMRQRHRSLLAKSCKLSLPVEQVLVCVLKEASQQLCKFKIRSDSC